MSSAAEGIIYVSLASTAHSPFVDGGPPGADRTRRQQTRQLVLQDQAQRYGRQWPSRDGRTLVFDNPISPRGPCSYPARWIGKRPVRPARPVSGHVTILSLSAPITGPNGHMYPHPATKLGGNATRTEICEQTMIPTSLACVANHSRHSSESSRGAAVDVS